MRISDWSSDVCSSDLLPGGQAVCGGELSGPHELYAARAAFEQAGRNRPSIRDSQCPSRKTQLSRRPFRGGQGISRRVSPRRAVRLPLWRRQGRGLARRLVCLVRPTAGRSEEHTSELQYLSRTSYAVFCFTKNTI